jgi:hypothetical protein
MFTLTGTNLATLDDVLTPTALIGLASVASTTLTAADVTEFETPPSLSFAMAEIGRLLPHVATMPSGC